MDLKNIIYIYIYSNILYIMSSLSETDLLYAAKVYRDERLQRKAELMTLENCKELDRLNNLFRGG